MRFLAIASSLLLFLSCATFVSDYKDFHAPTAANEKPFPALNIYLKHSFEYKTAFRCDEIRVPCPAEANTFPDDKILRAFHSGIRYSSIRYFERISPGNNINCAETIDCDITMEFSIRHLENAFLETLAKMVTFGSLAIIPTPFPVTYEFGLKIFDKNGKSMGEYRRSEKMTEWVHFSFLFFRNKGDRFKDSRKILKDVVGNILRQVKDDGVLLQVEKINE